MKQKLREIVDTLDHDDLVKLQSDLATGGQHIQRLVLDKMREIEEIEKKVCVVCERPINPYDSNYFTLIFGPPDFRKRASFCAIDCLEYFLSTFRLPE